MRPKHVFVKRDYAKRINCSVLAFRVQTRRLDTLTAATDMRALGVPIERTQVMLRAALHRQRIDDALNLSPEIHDAH